MSVELHEYAFPAPVLRLEEEFAFHYIPIPDDIADALQAAGVKRVISEINGRPYRRAIQNRVNTGERILIVGQDIIREAGAALGDMVMLVLRPDPDPDFIDLGEEFTAVLEEDREAAERFFAMTPGRRRSLAYYATSAKRPETRLKRALELAHKLRTNTLYGDLNRK